MPGLRLTAGRSEKTPAKPKLVPPWPRILMANRLDDVLRLIEHLNLRAAVAGLHNTMAPFPDWSSIKITRAAEERAYFQREIFSAGSPLTAST
jgi:hypothetical protein